MGGIRKAPVLAGCLGLVLAARAAPALAEQPSTIEELRGLSIEQLGQIQVTSVGKEAQPLGQAPAAIYVITHDAIERSGAVTLPEVLRLAPNLEVYRTSASAYVITARGFNGSAADQDFSNKLLVLIDGRSVYSPMFSGVFWDMQDVAVDDIDRIEVISGPGATLWGANAVNGVINIITRKAEDSQGGLVSFVAGSLDSALTLRYGGKAGDKLAWRAYAKETVVQATQTPAGTSAHDSWRRASGGFRLDYAPTVSDDFRLSGDALGAAESVGRPRKEDIEARNLTGSWAHAFANGHRLQVLGYYDYVLRNDQIASGVRFDVNTFDLQAQDSFALGERHALVIGAEARSSGYRITNTQSLLFAPTHRQLNLFDIFAQDTITLPADLRLVLGLKLEHDPYSGFTPLPDVRIAWSPTAASLAWAAASRAIRSPTPLDEDVIEKAGATVFLTGNPAFRPESLVAYQIGARTAVGQAASVSVSGFYNVYDDLRSVEITPVTFLPLYWGNGFRGRTYGVEAWADWQATPWWRLSPGVEAIHERFKFKPGAAHLLGPEEIADDPSVQAKLHSSMDIGRRVMVDLDLRYQSALPNPVVPAFVELNARLAWNLSPRLQLAIDGLNLLHARHQELPAPQATAVPRSVLGELRWRF